MDWLFNQRWVSVLLGMREHVLCLGDSHIRIMRNVVIPGVWLRAKPVSGATASGILNPESRTQASMILSALLDRAKPWQQVVLHLGEVDCGFVIWHRAERHGVSVDDQLSQTLDNYLTFIESVKERGFRRVIVLSSVLPTIGDDPAPKGEIARLRRQVMASQVERTTLTLQFNAALRERCRLLDVEFVDISSAQYDPDRQVIRPQFLRGTERDHHLADGPLAGLLEATLGPILQGPRPMRSQRDTTSVTGSLAQERTKSVNS